MVNLSLYFFFDFAHTVNFVPPKGIVNWKLSVLYQYHTMALGPQVSAPGSLALLLLGVFWRCYFYFLYLLFNLKKVFVNYSFLDKKSSYKISSKHFHKTRFKFEFDLNNFVLCLLLLKSIFVIRYLANVKNIK